MYYLTTLSLVNFLVLGLDGFDVLHLVKLKKNQIYEQMFSHILNLKSW